MGHESDNYLPVTFEQQPDQATFEGREEYGDPTREDAVRARVIGGVIDKSRPEVMCKTILDPLTGLPMSIERFKRVFRDELEFGFELGQALLSGRMFEIAATGNLAKASTQKFILEWMARKVPGGVQVDGWAQAPKRVNVQQTVSGHVNHMHADAQAKTEKAWVNIRSLVDGVGGGLRDAKADREQAAREQDLADASAGRTKVDEGGGGDPGF